MTADEDNKVIWFIRVTLDTFTIRACDNEFSDLVLSGNTWKHDVIKFNSISEINENIDVENGGNVGLLTNFEFEISRKVNDSNLTDFFNSLAPATSKPYITSRIVEVGVAWDTANLIDETDITWFHEFYIEDYSYDYSSMRLFCIEFAELESKELPPYKIQKDYDDAISYYEDAVDGSYEQTIPIIYGDYTTLNLEYSQFSLAPAIRVDSFDNWFKISCHKMHTIDPNNYLYRYMDNLETVMKLKGATTANENGYKGHLVKASIDGTIIYGEIILQPKTASIAELGTTVGYSNVSVNQNILDNDSTTYDTIATSSVTSILLGTNLSTSEMGINSGQRNDVSFNVVWSSDDANTQDIRVLYYHPDSIQGSIAGFSSLFTDDSTNGTIKTTNFFFGDGNYDYGTNPTKWIDTADWSIEELQRILYVIVNLNTSSTFIRIYNVYLKMDNIRVFDKRVIDRFTISTMRPPRQTIQISNIGNP
jgi:hypothetical protein